MIISLKSRTVSSKICLNSTYPTFQKSLRKSWENFHHVRYFFEDFEKDFGLPRFYMFTFTPRLQKSISKSYLILKAQMKSNFDSLRYFRIDDLKNFEDFWFWWLRVIISSRCTHVTKISYAPLKNLLGSLAWVLPKTYFEFTYQK